MQAWVENPCYSVTWKRGQKPSLKRPNDDIGTRRHGFQVRSVRRFAFEANRFPFEATHFCLETDHGCVEADDFSFEAKGFRFEGKDFCFEAKDVCTALGEEAGPASTASLRIL